MMKKRIIKLTVAAMVVATTGYGIFLSQNKDNGLSELALVNAEALATGETGGETIHCCGNYGTCMNVVDDHGKPFTVAGIKYIYPCP